MATIFLSYRRTDSPQACRVYDWLVRRFGRDAVFMDVADIPFATRFTDYIKQEIVRSSVLVALIGNGWQEKLVRAEDAVLMEIETAVANDIPVLPVLIGTTPMPNAETLPPSIASIAYQNASIVGVSRDFDTHMQALVPKVEAILGTLSRQSSVTADPYVVSTACTGVIKFLRNELSSIRFDGSSYGIDWEVFSTNDLPVDRSGHALLVGGLYLHRVARLAELLELHFILVFWAETAHREQTLAGVVMRKLEQTPVIPEEFLEGPQGAAGWGLKIRHSDEDARQIWKMITDGPLQLSLAYIATISPKVTTPPAGQ